MPHQGDNASPGFDVDAVSTPVDELVNYDQANAATFSSLAAFNSSAGELKLGLNVITTPLQFRYNPTHNLSLFQSHPRDRLRCPMVLSPGTLHSLA